MTTSPSAQRLGSAVATIALLSAGLAATAVAPASAVPVPLPQAATTALGAAIGTAPTAPVGLLTNDLDHPMNVEGAPRFAWLPQDADANETQTAYQLQVLDDAGEVVWDSGQQASAEQSNVAYAGDPLASGSSYAWRVRTWDATDLASPWSATAPFDTGISDAEWSGASWIKRTPSASNDVMITDEDRLRIRGTSANEFVRARSGAEWTDYEVSMKVTPVARGAGILFRSPDAANGYMWQLSPDGLKTHRRTGGSYPQDARRTVPVTPAITLGTTYDVRIRVEGRRIQTFIDDRLVDDWTDPSTAGSTAGTIGFRHTANSGGADIGEFDDVRVTSLDGATVLLADDFSGDLAQWVVPTGGTQEADDYTLLRTDVELADKEVVRARSYVAGSHTYELTIDGERADRGQSFSYPGEGYYQAADVTDLVRGKTQLALGATLHWYSSGQGRPAGVPGLLAKVVVEYADGTEQVITTDDTWRARRGPYVPAGTRNGEGEYLEHYDATLAAAIGDWTSYGYDDSGWAPAEEIGAHPVAPFTHLTGQEPRITETVVHPVAILTADDGTQVADFGTVVPARPSVAFDEGVAGRTLPLRASYRLAADGRVATDRVATQGTNMSFPYTQVAGEQQFDAFTHLAFRYLEIPGADEEITVDDVSATVVHSSVPEGRDADFDSSDETLDAVWDLMERSALYSVQEQFVDTPTREKGQFLHDTVNLSAATTLAFGERAHSRQAIREFMNSQARYWTTGNDAGRYNAVYPNGDGKRDIPDFTLTVPGWIWNYYRQTGDRAMLAETYDELRATAGYVLRHIPETGPTAGLVTQLSGGSGPYLHGIVDWPEHGRFGYDMTATARTTVNALSVDVLTRVAEMGELLGEDAADVAALRTARDELVDRMNATLRREDGRYVDGLLADGSQSPVAGQHATSYALAFDVAPEADRPALAEAIAGMGMRQGPMTVHWLAQALGENGQDEALLRLLTNPDDHGWARTLAEGNTFTPESWVQDSSANSLSHGWSTNTMADVVEQIVGIRLAEPGAAALEVVVPDISLEEASGTVHTQRGPVSVAWDRSGAGTAATVTVPVNATATVSLPVAEGNAFAARNGAVEAERVSVADGRAVYRIGSGTWTFAEEADTGGPVEASVSDAGQDGWYGADAELTLTAEVPEGVEVQYAVGDGAWTAYTAPVALAEGSYDVRWRKVRGDVTGGEGSLAVKVDATLPTATATLGADRRVTIAAADRPSGVASVRYRVGDGEWTDYTEPFPVGDERTTVTWEVTDLAGNTAPAGSLDVAPAPRPGLYGTGSNVAPQSPWNYGRLGTAKPISVFFEGEDGSAVSGTVFVTIRRAGTAQVTATAFAYDGARRQVATPVLPRTKGSYQVGVVFVPDDDTYRVSQRHFWIWATPTGRP
ncbi:family 78 glycoside hydrolase catalytic domain [Nocardioides sp. CPCC 205120]|uniref:family 78 glycoside hydrolase catalytic domain n=1 Tax=Nocardioides sp. CPCC 205120 TaxID=3406462 RepID=UPI003B500DC5